MLLEFFVLIMLVNKDFSFFLYCAAPDISSFLRYLFLRGQAGWEKHWRLDNLYQLELFFTLFSADQGAFISVFGSRMTVKMNC